jgi:hypothetical protein
MARVIVHCFPWRNPENFGLVVKGDTARSRVAAVSPLHSAEFSVFRHSAEWAGLK